MIGTELAVAGLGLAVAVALGLVAHELAHALVLRLARIDHTVSFVPGRTEGVVRGLTSGKLAVVSPHPTGREPAVVLRAAALAPVLLAVPVFALGAGGALPADSLLATAVAIGWLACAIPSPQDFSVVFYADRALETDAVRDTPAATTRSRAD